MKCKEVKKTVEIYSDEEMQSLGMYDEVKSHIQECIECREYLNDVKRTREVVVKFKKYKLEQYQLLKKDSREFNDDIWSKIRETKNKEKSFLFIWIEVLAVIVLIGISIWNYKLLSKELMVVIGTTFMIIGMVYTNRKEVESNE